MAKVDLCGAIDWYQSINWKIKLFYFNSKQMFGSTFSKHLFGVKKKIWSVDQLINQSYNSHRLTFFWITQQFIFSRGIQSDINPAMCTPFDPPFDTFDPPFDWQTWQTQCCGVKGGWENTIWPLKKYNAKKRMQKKQKIIMQNVRKESATSKEILL